MGRRGIGSRGAGPSAGPSQYASARPQSGSRAAPKKPGHGATYSVLVMTAASLVGVAVLAAQAAATAPKVSSSAIAKTGGTVSTPQAKGGTPAASGTHSNATALPANSGSGPRIVYGEAAKRVWLVSASNAVVRTFVVVPGTVTAPTGNFSVTNRLSSAAGTDGTPVQYVVLFNKARVDGSSTAFGFDAVANVTGMPPAPTARTGGVRMTQADAQALWTFSNFGTVVVVMP